MQDYLPTHCPQCGTDLTSIRASIPASQTLHYCSFCQFPAFLLTGKYLFEKLLGEGAFGRVYLVRHALLQRDAERAAKLIPSDGPEHLNMRSRFLREVQSTATVSQRNEHIVRVYDDFGEIEELQMLYYVMEYLEGKPLTELITSPEGLPNLTTCLKIFLQICKGMNAAHQADIIHRDLKPDNILLVERNQDPHFVKIVDFGIARPLDEAAESLNLTQGALGTPLYMAPEQCTQQKVDARTDVYALGSILFELLVGHPPFYPKNRQVTSFELITSQIMHAAPSPKELRPDRDIPEALSQAVLKSLEKKPKNRFQSMEEFAQAVLTAYPTQLETIQITGFGTTPPPSTQQTNGVSTLPDGEIILDGVAASKESTPSLPTTAGVSEAVDINAKTDELAEDKATVDEVLGTLALREAAGVGSSKGRWTIPVLILLFLVGGVTWYMMSSHPTEPKPDKRRGVLVAQKKRIPPVGKAKAPPGPDAGEPADNGDDDDLADDKGTQLAPVRVRRRRIRKRRRVRPRRRIKRPAPPRVETREVIVVRPEVPHPKGCPKLPGVQWVRLSIKPRGLSLKIATRGRYKNMGGGKICLAFSNKQARRLKVKALLYRPCSARISPRSIYQTWTLQRFDPNEPEGGQDDYCSK